MSKRTFAVIFLTLFIFFSFFVYFDSFRVHQQDFQTVGYSLDKMYAQHSFEKDFKKFNFWDIISKSDIDKIKSKVKTKQDNTKFEKVFYNTGIYTWPLYSSYAWRLVESNITCPKNMNSEQFEAFIRNMTPKYEKLRETQGYYLNIFKKLEDEITEPRAYALLAWLELLLVNDPDVVYDKYAKEYGFSEDVCRSLLGIPEYYENYVFPYVEQGIQEVTKLNSKSTSNKALSKRAYTIIQNRGSSLNATLAYIYKTKQGSLEVYGAYGLTYYQLSKNVSSRGFYALGLFYFSWAEGYYSISKNEVTKVPMRLNYPFNVSKVRNMVYSETIDLINKLHENDFYTLDPLISQVLLYHIGRVDYKILPKLEDKNSTLYFTYPSEVYTEYLRILAKIRGIKQFYEYLTQPE